MKTVVVACRTLQDELEASFCTLDCDYSVHWIESGLHNTPAKLRERLQQTLDGLTEAERVLMAFGFCGNAMAGLDTGAHEVILPRADDCISLVLGSSKRRAAIGRTYFLTRGWLRGERTIWDEYQYTVEKYGEETGREIFNSLLGNYRCLGLIDTGCYPVLETRRQAQTIADGLGLELTLLPGSPDYVSALLSGPWDDTERFLVFPPHTVISAAELTLP